MINYLINDIPIVLAVLLGLLIMFCFISGFLMLFVPFWILQIKDKIKYIEAIVELLKNK